MTTTSGSQGLIEYLARLPGTVTDITLTTQMVKDFTGRAFRTEDWSPGDAIDGWEVVEAIPQVGLALRRA
jgi:hypothetical protein